MPFPPLFMRLRAIAFCLICILCFVWVSLLATYLFLNWDTTDSLSLLSVMLCIDAATPIVLLILLILPFRPWLDAARLLLLALAQFGIAGVFSHWFPRLQCPNPTADGQAVCHLVNLGILLASWVVPALLVTYAGGLAYAMRARKSPQIRDPMTERESILPVMRPGYVNSRATSYSASERSTNRGSAEEQRKHISGIMTIRSSATQSLTKPAPAFFT
ncbi:hypothetical protein C8F01DRAFT_1131881 [Mycena amicta]|nr:hypothetical protein C8F01DRAFT_1131881 [Mycena amicta]